MKVIQLLSTITFGDAVSNETLAFHDALKRHGYDSCVFAENIGKGIKDPAVKHVDKLGGVESDDIIIYHLSTGTKLNYRLADFNCKKIIRYHNITPPGFYSGYSIKLYQVCMEGRKGMREIAREAQYVLADSLYNKQDFIEAGCMCIVDVMPILIPLDDYKKEPSKKIINKYKDGFTNIVFVGRIAPNKKQEDIIAAFDEYQRNYNKRSMLILVGNSGGMEEYLSELQDYVKRLGTENVVFTGQVKFDEILAYYKVADVFLCMSEHEGFCVPLVEAMCFEVPIIAYRSTAVPDTLGGAGLVLDKKDPIETAGLINYLMTHKDLADELRERERMRLADFSHDKIEKQLISAVECVAEGEGAEK